MIDWPNHRLIHVLFCMLYVVCTLLTGDILNLRFILFIVHMIMSRVKLEESNNNTTDTSMDHLNLNPNVSRSIKSTKSTSTNTAQTTASITSAPFTTTSKSIALSMVESLKRFYASPRRNEWIDKTDLELMDMLIHDPEFGLSEEQRKQFLRGNH